MRPTSPVIPSTQFGPRRIGYRSICGLKVLASDFEELFAKGRGYGLDAV